MTDNAHIQSEPSSFRDPSGFIYYRDGAPLRQVNKCYASDYRQLMDGGLYDALTRDGLLVPHRETDLSAALTKDAYCVLKPEPLSMVTYPYEWCYGQLREAALTTLRIQRTALDYGMTLKDATAFNIQFSGAATPILIDTLSFQTYQGGQPWVAYRQFCQHFLAPLALAAYLDVRLLHLLRSYVDGIPLDLASRLLPVRTRLSPGLLAHIHLHSASQKRHSDRPATSNTSRARTTRVSKLGLIGILENLTRSIQKLHWKGAQTEWGSYYDDTNYVDDAMHSKEAMVESLIKRISPQPTVIVDLGANTGRFSRLARSIGALAVAADIDPVAVERNYAQMTVDRETSVIPLLLDLTNPPGASGWANVERPGVFERLPRQTMMALALVHHLAISNNLSLTQLCDFFAEQCENLIIEFVPKSDSQVQRLLASREDIFPDYTQTAFEKAFTRRFTIIESVPIEQSERCLYLMQHSALGVGIVT